MPASEQALEQAPGDDPFTVCQGFLIPERAVLTGAPGVSEVPGPIAGGGMLGLLLGCGGLLAGLFRGRQMTKAVSGRIQSPLARYFVQPSKKLLCTGSPARPWSNDRQEIDTSERLLSIPIAAVVERRLCAPEALAGFFSYRALRAWRQTTRARCSSPQELGRMRAFL